MERQTYYVDIAENGNIIGFYVDAIHGENIPPSAFPISFEQWQLYSTDATIYKQDGNTIREKTPLELEGEMTDSPGSEPSTQEQIKVLDERTVGMQAIDDFTLQAQATIDERTVGMQEIDDFTLLQVTDLQQQVDQLKADVAALKGGV